MRAEHYAEVPRQYATYCRNHGDNTLYRIAAGASDADYHWTETLMKVDQLTSAATGRPARHLPGAVVPLLHGPRRLEHKGSATEFGTDEYYTTLVKAARSRSCSPVTPPSWTATTRTSESA